MKLIDILVEELPKRDGWPEKASHAVYAKRFSRVCFTVGGAPAITGDDVSIFEDDGAGRDVFWLPGIMLNCVEPVDYATAIITREQYEAALAASKRCDHKWVPSEGRTQSGYLCSKCGNYDGPGYDWIEWGGGECPVEKGVLVDVRLRNGNTFEGLAALVESRATLPFWLSDDAGADIIAYRLHRPQEAEQAEADDEADLNECIGQDAALVWNGDGAIPPVGCVCERSWAGDEWQSCKILFASGQIVVVKLKESGREDAYNIGDVIFRPIRPEAERKRDDICDKIYGAMTNAKRKDNRSDMAEEIYDAIAAGKIPGVKLED